MFRKLFGIGDLSPEKFTRFVARTGVELGRLEEPAVDTEKMTISDRTGMMDLHNVYANFLALPRRKRMGFVRDVILGPLPDVPETWDELASMLLPVVRDGAYLTFAKLQVALAGLGEQAGSIAHRELAPNLFETLVIDTPDKMMQVTNEKLAEWGVSFEEALDRAHAKLRRSSLDSFQQVIPGLWVAPWADAYAAARAVLPDLLQRVCTNPLVALPNRETLLVADPSMPGAFEKLVTVLLKIDEDGAPYAITRRIYQLEDKTLRAYAPPAESASATAYQRLLVIEQATNYEREKELQEQLGTDAFYAKILALETVEGEIVTRAAWTKGVDETYLPPTQAIHFVDLDDGPKAMRLWEVPWNVVVANGLVTATNDLLPRWRTGDFPSVAWLAEHGTLLKDGADPA